MRRLVALAAVALLPTAAPHPLDGPDLDLRVRITESAVTLDVGLNLAFLDEVLPMARADEFEVAEHEQPLLRDRAFAWLRLRTRVRVDAQDVPLELAGFHVDPGDRGTLPLFPNFGSKALVHARFRLACPTTQPPGTVNLVWQAFPPDLATDPRRGKTFLPVRAQLIAGGDERTIELRHDEPEFTWHAPEAGLTSRLLPVPRPVGPATVALPVSSLAALVVFAWWARRSWSRRRRGEWRRGDGARLAGVALLGVGLAVVLWPTLPVRLPLPWRARADLPTATQAAAIFLPLHENVYRAFDLDSPSRVYDALAASVDGSLLDTVYQDVYRSLVMHDQAGAVGRIRALRPLTTAIESIGLLDDGATPSFTVDASWQVDASVFHWGHAHERSSALRARYTVVGTAEGWRIAGAEPLQQERLLPRAPAAETGR
ncbi:MAG: hypothetical protein R3F56_15455 [Planctomycetota bacterium]